MKNSSFIILMMFGAIGILSILTFGTFFITGEKNIGWSFGIMGFATVIIFVSAFDKRIDRFNEEKI